MAEEKMHPLVRDNQVILAAGVYDALSAKLAERAGFKVVVLTGFGVAATLIGEPDFGILTQTQILDAAWRVVDAVEIPVVVDGDTGYGGALNVMHMVSELVRMGASGILLEDQTWPKRCGHMRGKSVVPAEEHVAKIRAAREARGDALFTITARTDARDPLGLEEAILRGKAYKEAGADLIFIEAPQSVEELKRIAEEVPGPLVINNIEGGRTPILPLEELREMGFISVGYVLSGLFASAKALSDTYAYLLEHGNTGGIRDSMMPFDEFNEMIGLEEKFRLDEQFG